MTREQRSLVAARKRARAIELYRSGVTNYATIGRRLGRSRYWARQIFQALGERRRDASGERAALALAERLSGELTWEEIAADLGYANGRCASSAVRVAFGGLPPGCAQRADKTTPAQREEIRRRRAAGECRESLAREFGVSVGRISDIAPQPRRKAKPDGPTDTPRRRAKPSRYHPWQRVGRVA